MKKLWRAFNRKQLKKDARQLGINLMTASVVGGFVSHATAMMPLAVILIVWVGIVGLILVLFGLHQVK